MSAHRIHHDLYRGTKVLTDPGDAGAIVVAQDLQICELASVESAETRTLATPTKPGIRFHLRFTTDNGDVVVTAAGTLNTTGNTTATFDDVGEALDLISVTDAGTVRWDIVTNTDSVDLA